MGVYGIDLGTTNSAIAAIDRDGRPEVIGDWNGAPTTPSVVLLPSVHDHVVGEGARRQARLDPDNVCALVKRRMGEVDWRFVAHGRSWSAPAISALILKSLVSNAEFAGEKVERAVITVPAYFGDEERRATIQAGTYAGLDVAGVLSEPIAAALSYGFSRLTDTATPTTPDETVLVYDLGGGTFDATVIELTDRRISVLAVDGDHQLGGADWDERLALYLSRKFCEEHPDAEDPLDDSAGSQALIMAAERAKHELSESDSTSVIVSHDGVRSVLSVTRTELEELTAGLLARTLDLTDSCLAGARRRGVAQVDRVLLVGGSSRMPAVTREISARLGITPELRDPDLAVARGAAIYGEKLEIERLVTADLTTRGRLAPGATLVDAAPADVDEAAARVAAAFAMPVAGVRRMLQISVDTVVSRGFGVLAVSGRNGELEVTWLVHRNQPLPIRVQRSFGTVRADQRRIELTVVEQLGQEASPSPRDAKMLIEGAIEDIPPGHDENSEVRVTFEMGFDGVLHVRAHHVEADIPLTLTAKTGATLSRSEVARELDQVHRSRRRDV
ncbi:Hsp70 family protein [Gordonia sp. L191]|uniref:Hsp70 family protein n=1 Tax=Gordonia sp. L191 TaxID=2982699 RepID=UPI0024C01B23|nr:Hsp70 family protein [Gordonia sp. L191]WHU46113.1 Hsp70 family protein [Gordonia sp. L191]